MENCRGKMRIDHQEPHRVASDLKRMTLSLLKPRQGDNPSLSVCPRLGPDYISARDVVRTGGSSSASLSSATRAEPVLAAP